MPKNYLNDNFDFISSVRLHQDCLWYCAPLEIRKKMKLLSPFVHATINELSEDWQELAHAVHRDIWDEFNEYTLEIQSQTGSMFRLEIQDYWDTFLKHINHHPKKLPESLKTMIYDHL